MSHRCQVMATLAATLSERQRGRETQGVSLTGCRAKCKEMTFWGLVSPHEAS